MKGLKKFGHLDFRIRSTDQLGKLFWTLPASYIL